MKQRRCDICDGPIVRAFRGHPGVCDAWPCRVAHRGRLREAQAAERNRERGRRTQTATSERDQAAAARGIASPESYKPSLLHAMPLRVIPLTASRRHTFLAHVRTLIDEVDPEGAGVPHPKASAAPPRFPERGPSSLAQCACATCCGACCQGGANTAFLTLENVREIMASPPGELVADRHNAYASHLPDHVIEDSCVFHTVRGCSLPRRLRADTCNSFACEGLRDLLRQFHEQGRRRFCLFARNPHEEPRIVFIEVDNDGGTVRCAELD